MLRLYTTLFFCTIMKNEHIIFRAFLSYPFGNNGKSTIFDRPGCSTRAVEFSMAALSENVIHPMTFVHDLFHLCDVFLGLFCVFHDDVV